MRTLIMTLAALLMSAAVSAQQQPRITVNGEISTGGREVDNDTNSSKLTEYRDLRDDAYLPRLHLNLLDSLTGRFFQFTGQNVSLDDQALAFRGGKPGQFNLNVDWSGIPHNFSNKAQTPYLRKAPGLFETPANVPITFKKLATAAADTPGVLASDQLIADYQAAFLRPTPLSTQTSIGRVVAGYSAFDSLNIGVEYNRQKKEGLQSSFGPIGDRPPRTLNIQLTEPVDYRTNDVTLSAEHVGRRFQAQFSYTLSDFANKIDTLQWENIYATPAPGSTFDEWDRSVSVFGRRALAPDNRYHNLSLSAGVNLPGDSLLNATFAYGQSDQNETLLPYSYNSNVLANPTLPRGSAQAQIQTSQVLVDYTVTPAAGLNLRAWARYFGVDNNTPMANWQYVTSDTSNLNGTVSYKNKRVNLAYASDRSSAGGDLSYRVRRSTVSLGYEREAIDRDFREADTTEHRLTLAWRLRPASRVNVRARYGFGNRNGDYDPFVTRQSYWYTSAEANDADNPGFSFSNHPDMVRFDVSDRKRHQGEITLTLNPREAVSISGNVRLRRDNFDSDVRPTLPFAGRPPGEVDAASPGDQLGLIDNTHLRYSLDAVYMPSDRFSFNLFGALDDGRSTQRGLEYDENRKLTPSGISTAELGPWTRKSSQWTTDFKDRTWTFGFGGSAGLVPERVTLDATYSVSLGNLDTIYGGYGLTNWDGTPFPPNHQFAFGPAPRVNQDLRTIDVRLRFPVIQQVEMVLGYNYERFRQDDWQQGTTFPWVEPVGSEFLLRDSSRSYQWGNRLFNLGSFLAPSFNAHVVFASFNYRF